MNTKHRSASREKRRYAADPMAMYRVLNRLQEFTEEEQKLLTNPLRAAFERLRSGAGDANDWQELASATNIALIRSESVDPLCVETCMRAQDALLRAKDRYQRMKVWGFDGQALQDIPPLLDLHEQFVTLSTPLQMQQAVRETYRRMRSGQVHRIEGQP